MRRAQLTPEVIEKISNLIKVGNYPAVAARGAGVSERTFYLWLKKGREGKAPYSHLVQAIEEANTSLEIALVATIRKALPENPGFAFEMLKRRFGERWNTQHPQHIQVQTTNQVVVNNQPAVEPDRALELVKAQLEADEINRRN